MPVLVECSVVFSKRGTKTGTLRFSQPDSVKFASINNFSGHFNTREICTGNYFTSLQD